MEIVDMNIITVSVSQLINKTANCKTSYLTKGGGTEGLGG